MLSPNDRLNYKRVVKDVHRVGAGNKRELFLRFLVDVIKLVIQLIDIRTGPTDDDIMMINFLIDNGVKFIVVATKTDKLSKTQLANALEDLHNEYFNGTGIEIIPFSSITRVGKDEVWKKITDAIS